MIKALPFRLRPRLQHAAAGLLVVVLFGHVPPALARDQAVFEATVDAIEAALAAADGEQWMKRIDQLHVEGTDLAELTKLAESWEAEAAKTRRKLAEAAADEAFSARELAEAGDQAAKDAACRRYQVARYRFGTIEDAWLEDGHWVIDIEGDIVRAPAPGTEAYEAARRLPPPGSANQIREARRLAASIVGEKLDLAALAARREALAQRAAALQVASTRAGNPTARFYLRLLGRFSGWDWAAGTQLGRVAGTGGSLIGRTLGMKVRPGALLAGPVGWVLTLIDLSILGIGDYIVYEDQEANKEHLEYSHRNILELEQLRATRALEARELESETALNNALGLATGNQECADAIQTAIEESIRQHSEAEAAENELSGLRDPGGENDPMWHPRRLRAGLIRIMYEAAKTAQVNAARRMVRLRDRRAELCPDRRMGFYLPREPRSCDAEYVSYQVSPFAMLTGASLVLDAPHAYIPHDKSRHGPPEECPFTDGPEGTFVGIVDQCEADAAVCACETAIKVPAEDIPLEEERPEPEMVTVGIKATQTAIAGREGETFAGGMIQFDVGADPELPIAGIKGSDVGYSEGAYKAVTGEDGKAVMAVPAWTVADGMQGREIEVTLDSHRGRLAAMEDTSGLSSMPEELKGYVGEPYEMAGLVIVPFMFPLNRLESVELQLEKLGGVAYIENDQCWPIQPRLRDDVVSDVPAYPTQVLRFE
jgi:hypothetical protein